MPGNPGATDAMQGEAAPDTIDCYRCGETLTRGVKVCPNCETNFVRLCTCSAEIRAYEAACSECGHRREARTYTPPRRVKRWISIAFALAAVAAGWWYFDSGPGRPPEPWELRDQALASFEKGEFAAALADFERLIDGPGGDAEAWTMIALSQRKL